MTVLISALVLAKVAINTGLKLVVISQLVASVQVLASFLAGSASAGVRCGARILMAGLVAAFLVLALTTLERPFLPVFLFLTVVCVFWACSVSGGLRALAVNAAVLLGTLAVAETLWSGTPSSVFRSRETESVVVTERSTGRRLAGGALMAPDPIRGFAAPEGCTVRVTRSHGRQVLADVLYTIGPVGVRETGIRYPGGSPRRVLFLGDSFAFGEGVGDGETAPAQLELALPDVTTVNLGFKGYGAHQALASLENQLEVRASPGAYNFAVYYAYLDLNRAAGRAPWDTTGPRYTLSEDGGVAFSGPFSSSARLRGIALLNRGFVFSKAITRFLVSEGDIDLFARILFRVKEVFRERYDAGTLFLLWGEDNPWYTRAIAALRSCGLDVHTRHQVLPEAETNRSQWVLPDGHPNAAAQRRVAEYLARQIKTR